MATEQDRTAFALIASLSRIEDRRQRSYALARRLNDLDPDDVIDVIKVIQEKALSGDADSLRLYNGLLVRSSMEEVFGEQRMATLVKIAREKGDIDIMAVLADVPFLDREDRPRQPFLDGALREIPLGMRKTLARKPDFRLIQRIAKDQDHRVIEHLLDNPRITEKDVIKIGSTRPTSPKVLEAIYNHPRWISRYSIKKTIVFNPYAPLSLTLSLLTYLNVQDLELLITMPELDARLIDEAQRNLARRCAIEPTEYCLEPED